MGYDSIPLCILNLAKNVKQLSDGDVHSQRLIGYLVSHVHNSIN
uniref:Uncharacterized protein n=1 Tax=Anguilla anguilla TaxID=7936 RepID=A0A0E9R9F7_ANGAN